MRFKIMYIYMRLKRMQRCLYMRFKRMYIYMRLKRMQRYILYMRLKPMQSSTCALSACRAIFFYIYYILFFYICHIHVLSCPAPMVYTNNIIPESFYIQQNHLTKIYQNHYIQNLIIYINITKICTHYCHCTKRRSTSSPKYLPLAPKNQKDMNLHERIV